MNRIFPFTRITCSE